MMRFVFVWIAILFLGNICLAQIKPIAIEKADSLISEQPKPLIILVSTEWCKYCQMQKMQLQKNEGFIRRADNFYYIEFNAESRERIRFHNQDYDFQAKGSSTGIHELAVALNGSDRVSFPTWVLLDKNYQVLFRYNGVLTEKQLNELMEAIDKLK